MFQVINIINAAQENSPLTVSQALDKVLEILQTSELYSPFQYQEIRTDDDPMASDFVEGLMSVCDHFFMLYLCVVLYRHITGCQHFKMLNVNESSHMHICTNRYTYLHGLTGDLIHT